MIKFKLSFVLVLLVVFAFSPSLNDFFEKNNHSKKSLSKGSFSKGSLVNGVPLRPVGLNYSYFSEESYLNGRGFVHSKVRDILEKSFDALYLKDSTMKYFLMEGALKNGGKIWPHRTHQNGLSIDLMIPLKKNDKPYYGLSDKGIQHYFLEFDESGYYKEDPEVEIDFEELSKMIYFIHENAVKQNAKVSKVILKIEYKSLLFKTKYGKLLKGEGVYFANKLSSRINNLHDDHIHIDFKL